MVGRLAYRPWPCFPRYHSRLAAGLGNVAHTAFISLTNDRGLTGLQDKLDRRFNAVIFN